MAVLTSKAQGTEGSSKGLGGLRCRGEAERGERDPHPARLLGAGGICTPKMGHLGDRHLPPNPS